MFGVLNLNKPAGVTSRDVVNTVQRIVRPTKVGHAGTLDPMATGVLLVCIGKATRLISMLQQTSKTYLAEFQLGQRSDTDDSTGSIEHVKLPGETPSREQLQSSLQSFVGRIQQIPPAFSAVKVNGRRAYAKAREGETVTLTAKTVDIYRIELLDYQWPQLSLSIECGSGTYVRSIARDLGEQLGCGGLMSALQRTRIGEFPIAKSIAPESITPENLSSLVFNPIGVVQHLSQYQCSDAEIARLHTGNRLVVDPIRLRQAGTLDDRRVAMTSSDGLRLLALAEFCDDRRQLQPRHVFVDSQHR